MQNAQTEKYSDDYLSLLNELDVKLGGIEVEDEDLYNQLTEFQNKLNYKGVEIETPSDENKKDYDIKAKFNPPGAQEGKEGEVELVKLLGKINTYEVKTDLKYSTTGNIAIETRYKGELSGINATKADMWVEVIKTEKDSKYPIIIAMPTEFLRQYLKVLLKEGKARKSPGGDNGDSELILVSLRDFFS